MKSVFWKSIVPLFCVLVIDAMTFGIVIPVLGPMILEPSSHFLPSDTSLNIRTLYYSLCLGLPMAFMFIGAPLLGDISDQIGRKKALLIALVGISVSCLMSAVGVIFSSIFLLLAGRCILGFMDSSESVAKAAIADISKTSKQKTLNLSFASVAGTAGFVLGPMIGGLVSNSQSNHWFSYVTPFYLAAGLALINAVVLFFLFNETFTPAEKKKIHLMNSFKHLAAAITDKRIQLLSIIFFCMQFGWGTYFQSISILLVKVFQFNSEQIGYFMSFLALCFVMTMLVIIRVMLYFFEQRTIIIIGLALVTMGSIIISIMHTPSAPWVSLVPMCLGVGLSYNTILTLFSDSVDRESQGRIMGASVGLFSMAWVISSVLSGLLAAVNLYLPYLLASIIGGIGFIAAFCIRKK